MLSIQNVLMKDRPPNSSLTFPFYYTATKAVHIALVSGCFLAALRQFMSRRHCPSNIISVNGSNLNEVSGNLTNYFYCVEKKKYKISTLLRELRGLSKFVGSRN